MLSSCQELKNQQFLLKIRLRHDNIHKIQGQDDQSETTPN